MIIVPVLDLAWPLASLLPRTATPYIALVLAGFAIGILGHLAGSRRLIVAGIALIFLGALLFPVAINLLESTPPEASEGR